jgi:site-specific recombinase XerD
MEQNALLISDFRRWWMLKRRAEATIRNYVYSLERISKWLAEAGTDLTTADRRSLEAFMEQRYTECAPRTAHTDYKAMRAFYKWAVADKMVEVWKDPTDGIPGPTIPTEETEEAPIVVDSTAYDALVKTCRTTASMSRDARARAVRDHAIIAMLWWTGMRRSEVCRLDLSDVDLDAGEMKVYKRTKTGKPRIVPILSTDLMEVLDRWVRFRRVYRADDPALFIGVGKNGKKGRARLLPNGLGTMIRRRAEHARVEAPTHAFRRGRAEEFERDGADPVDVDRMMGWADDRQRRRYTRANGQRISNEALRALYANR